MASSSISHFFLRRQEKVTKKKSTPVCRRFAVSCVARLVRRLRNSRYALRQSAPTPPDPPPLLGGAQGEEKRKAGGQLVAHHFFNYRAGIVCSCVLHSKHQVHLSGRLLQGSMGSHVLSAIRECLQRVGTTCPPCDFKVWVSAFFPLMEGTARRRQTGAAFL
jgi:hypothetical protein